MGFSSTSQEAFLPDFCTKKILILGCGNRLFGDDGFGPAVADYVTDHYNVPDDVYVMDVGTGVRKLLFTLCLSQELPKRIVILDAVDTGEVPGELFELPLDNVPAEKVDDFSLHQVPSSNLARTLQDIGVDVRVIGCQVAHIPENICPGLSEPVESAVIKMCEKIVKADFFRYSETLSP